MLQRDLTLTQELVWQKRSAMRTKTEWTPALLVLLFPLLRPSITQRIANSTDIWTRLPLAQVLSLSHRTTIQQLMKNLRTSLAPALATRLWFVRFTFQQCFCDTTGIFIGQINDSHSVIANSVQILSSPVVSGMACGMCHDYSAWGRVATHRTTKTISTQLVVSSL